MNEKNCGACGTPMSKNRFKETDCPHCRSENFFGINVTPSKNIKNKDDIGVDPKDTVVFIKGQGNETSVEIEV